MHKRRVDILHQRDTPLRQLINQLAQPGIVQPRPGERDHVDIQSEFAGEGVDDGGFAGTGLAVEEVAAAEGDSAVRVPVFGAEEVSGVVKEELFDAGIEDDGAEGSFSTASNVAPFVVAVIKRKSRPEKKNRGERWTYTSET